MNILVLGAGGFIGHNLVKRLKNEGHKVAGVDLKYPEFEESPADQFEIGDLRDQEFCKSVFSFPFDRVYQLAADMGGAGFIFTGENDADVMHNSAQININVAHFASITGVKQLFYSSSACVYPEYPVDILPAVWDADPSYREDDAYPALPDNNYGWEKLFSERLYQAYAKNKGLNIRIARFHNTFGPNCTWTGGREKAPAAICRKVIQSDEQIDMWGDGKQTRSFLFIDECLEGIERLMQSDFQGPVNIGSDELVSIDELAEMAMEFKGKKLKINHITGPVGSKGRNSDNTLIEEKLGWRPTAPLKPGLEKLYRWIETQCQKSV